MIKLTELPVNPIRLALSMAVRTLLMAPAAAILALSVIDRACTPSCILSCFIRNTVHSKQDQDTGDTACCEYIACSNNAQETRVQQKFMQHMLSGHACAEDACEPAG